MSNKLVFEVIDSGFVKPVEDNFFHTIFGYAWSTPELDNEVTDETFVSVFLSEDTGNKIVSAYKFYLKKHLKKMMEYVEDIDNCKHFLPFENFKEELDRLIDCYNTLIHDWNKAAGVDPETLKKQSNKMLENVLKAQTENGKGDANYLQSFARNS